MQQSAPVMTGARVLLIEDEVRTAETLALYLEAEGHRTKMVHDGVEGLDEALSGKFDLILLDVMLPGMNGLDVCRAIRAKSDVPVVLVSARSQEADQIRGLDVGGDDYIVKPFSPRQVMARVRSALRRRGLSTVSTVRAGGLEVDRDAASVRLDGRNIAVTATELRILHLMITSGARVLTRDWIIAQVFGSDYEGLDRAVDVHMKNLRRKLGPSSTAIETVRGIGYRLRTPTA